MQKYCEAQMSTRRIWYKQKVDKVLHDVMLSSWLQKNWEGKKMTRVQSWTLVSVGDKVFLLTVQAVENLEVNPHSSRYNPCYTSWARIFGLPQAVRYPLGGVGPILGKHISDVVELCFHTVSAYEYSDKWWYHTQEFLCLCTNGFSVLRPHQIGGE